VKVEPDAPPFTVKPLLFAFHPLVVNVPVAEAMIVREVDRALRKLLLASMSNVNVSPGSPTPCVR